MRRTRDIYVKRKELIKSRMKREIANRMTVCPRNCKFNQRVSLDGNGMKTSLCLFGQPKNKKGELFQPSQIIVCNSIKQARECSARIPLYANQEEAGRKIHEEMTDPAVRMARYPELVTLDWVLDNELHNLKLNPPTKWVRLMLWFAAKFEDWAR